MNPRGMPGWSRIFLAALMVLAINLLWKTPLERLTGGGIAAELVFNVLPCAMVVARLLVVPSR